MPSSDALGTNPSKETSWWTFRIFLFFFCLGRGKGESEAPGRGVSVFIENPRRVLQEGEGPRGREGVCVELRGAKYFLFGDEMSTKTSKHLQGVMGPWDGYI